MESPSIMFYLEVFFILLTLIELTFSTRDYFVQTSLSAIFIFIFIDVILIVLIQVNNILRLLFTCDGRSERKFFLHQPVNDKQDLTVRLHTLERRVIL